MYFGMGLFWIVLVLVTGLLFWLLLSLLRDVSGKQHK
ncbi:MAG: hypothetical protein BMS9Abin26_0485 [Gammaproteobacteria bacterium]|nr:MAG: hypothetical protein BMS9Abin26_0485 [Gammaproteobacteria bacterium]